MPISSAAHQARGRSERRNCKRHCDLSETGNPYVGAIGRTRLSRFEVCPRSGGDGCRSKRCSTSRFFVHPLEQTRVCKRCGRQLAGWRRVAGVVASVKSREVARVLRWKTPWVSIVRSPVRAGSHARILGRLFSPQHIQIAARRFVATGQNGRPGEKAVTAPPERQHRHDRGFPDVVPNMRRQEVSEATSAQGKSVAASGRRDGGWRLVRPRHNGEGKTCARRVNNPWACDSVGSIHRDGPQKGSAFVKGITWRKVAGQPRC